MADETAKTDENTSPTLYSQVDQEIDGKRYKTGDDIDADLHAGTREVLKLNGLIGTNRPDVQITPPPAGMRLKDMTRDQLIAAIRLEMPFDDREDEELRAALTRIREENKARADAKAQPDDDRDADKPLDKQNGDELDATAAREEVTFGENVKTKADKAAAIQAARDAKANA